MNRTAALLALFAVSAAAGVWFFVPDDAHEPEAPGSCATTAECSSDVAAESAAASPSDPDTGTDSSPPAAPAPAVLPRAVDPPAPRAATPAEPAADGKALRAESDRLFAEGKPLEGIRKLREATAADPTAKNHGDLGDLLARLTAVDEALVHLRQAAELDPGNADRWIALANGYYQAVDPGAAWEAEKRAKEAEPGLVLGRDKSGRRVRQGDSEPRKP
jgi:tetratricopeptide (TPR) repeat protein